MLLFLLVHEKIMLLLPLKWTVFCGVLSSVTGLTQVASGDIFLYEFLVFYIGFKQRHIRPLKKQLSQRECRCNVASLSEEPRSIHLCAFKGTHSNWRVKFSRSEEAEEKDDCNESDCLFAKASQELSLKTFLFLVLFFFSLDNF